MCGKRAPSGGAGNHPSSRISRVIPRTSVGDADPDAPTQLVAKVTSSIRTGPVLPWRLPSVMWKHIYTGAMGMTYFSLAAGMFLTAFGRRIGVSYGAFGALGGLAYFAFVLQLFGAHAVTRSGHRRRFWFVFAMAGRLCRGLAIAAAFYLARWSVFHASAAFVLLLALSNAFAALSMPPWYSWLADLVPAEMQGSFWGRRDATTAFATILAIVPCALFYDCGVRHDLAMPALLVIFAAGLVLGYTDLFIHNTIPEPPMKRAPRRSLLAEVRMVLGDRGFRPWIVFACSWQFSMLLGASMMIVYCVDDLFAESFTVGILVVGVVPMTMRMLTSSYLGRLVDRFGTLRVLKVSHGIWAFLPVPWLLATPSTAVWWLIGMNVVGMPAVNAAMNAATKYVTRFPEQEDRAIYWAVASGLASVAAGLGAFTAGQVMELLKGWSASPGGLELNGFRLLFVISVALRIGAAQLVRRLPAPSCERETAEPRRRRRAA